MLVTSGRLARELGRLLRTQRESAGLTQEQLAERAGVKRQQLSRFEAGRQGTTTGLVEAVFAALGLQLRIAVEPMDAHLDAIIDSAAAHAYAAAAGLLAEFGASDDLAAFLGTRGEAVTRPDTVIDGAVAACLQGVPIVPTRVDLLFREADRFVCQAWQAQVAQAIDSLVTIDFLADLPPSVEAKIGDRVWQLRPLDEVMADHPDVARVVERTSRRSVSLPA